MAGIDAEYTLNDVLIQVEGERIRRINYDNAAKAAELGERRMSTKLAIELEESEKARRIEEVQESDREAELEKRLSLKPKRLRD